MSESRPNERAVERMREALASEAPPDLPWDRMEQRLLERIDRDPSAGARRSSLIAGRGARFAAALSIAAAVAIGVYAASRLESDAPARVRWHVPETIALLPGSASERDLSRLRSGDGVEAGEAPLTLVQAGTARVTLAPGARAVVVATPSADGALVLGLERGSLRAEVIPKADGGGLVERFAVDVGATRVAARGTAFRVIRGEVDVIVDLEHGAVSVGPAGRSGMTEGRVLAGRARAAFSLDGGAAARMLPLEEGSPAAETPPPSEPPPQTNLPIAPPASSVLRDPTARLDEGSAPQAVLPPLRSPAPRAAPSSAPLSPPSESPPIAPGPSPTLTRASVHAGLSGCFDAHYGKRDPSVRLSIAGSVTVSLHEDGAVSAVRFDPPLEPPFMQCVFNTLRPGKFVETNGPITVPFSLSGR